MNKIPGKKIFLMDGLGALVTSICLSVMLFYPELSGMPRRNLFILISAGLLLSVFSLSCYFRNSLVRKSYLLAIAVFNILYCCITAVFVIKHFSLLTTIGKIYFAGELLVILILVFYEWKIIQKTT